jgi:hypothetical protein
MVDKVAGWVWEENVNRFMRHLAYTVAYDFDDLDRGAVETGLKDTDAERGRWFDYLLVGQGQLKVELARDPDASPIMVRVSGDLDDVLAARVETLIAVFGDVSGDD